MGQFAGCYVLYSSLSVQELWDLRRNATIVKLTLTLWCSECPADSSQQGILHSSRTKCETVSTSKRLTGCVDDGILGVMYSYDKEIKCVLYYCAFGPFSCLLLMQPLWVAVIPMTHRNKLVLIPPNVSILCLPHYAMADLGCWRLRGLFLFLYSSKGTHI